MPWQTRLIWQDAFLNGFVWEYGRMSLYGTEILLWLLLLCYAAWLFSVHPKPSFSLEFFFHGLKKPAVIIYGLVVLFLLFAAVSMTWSVDRSLAWYGWVRLVEAIALMSLVVVFKPKVSRDEITFSGLAFVWVLSSSLQSIFASWQFFSQYTFANKWLGLASHFPNISGSIILQTSNERWLRAYGSLPHPNILGGFLAAGLFFLIFLAFENASRRRRIFVATNLIIILPALFFSFSRSAWLALITGLFIFGGWFIKKPSGFEKNYFAKILFLVVLLIAILAFNLVDPLLTRLEGIEPNEVDSIQQRLTYSEQALQLISQRPLSGYGINNYTLAIDRNIDSTWPGYYYQPVHNIYLLAFTELGLIGGSIFTLLIFLLLFYSFKYLNNLETVTAFSLLLGALIIGLVDHYFWTLYCGLLFFWLIVGINIRLINAEKK
ncbi:MAG: O-antigen ligase family protein [Patescibacteria group bacterium]|nr:O-antigen ligase family protein [Patescibacteria group bacterium]